LRKIRAVIDTNVFVSGAISPKGSPRRILEMARKRIFETVTSPSINQEILSVLHTDNIYAKYGINEDTVDGIASFLYEGTA
jgi:putative PIN family toxin of toxin-antitoxin system